MRVCNRPVLPALPAALLIGAILVAVAMAPLAATAAGGAIRVVQMQQQVNFPSGVGLSITVESDAEIEEVRVYYRAAGSRQWGYAYADFVPGTRIVATQSVPVRESTYIAPGADVEYYFEVRDVDGNAIRTDRAVVEYLDGQFDWQRASVGPLELLYHDLSDSRVEEAAQQLRQDLSRVQELLQLEQIRKFKGVIYNSYADANAAFPVTSQTTTDHGTFAGYAFPEQRVFVGQGLDRRIIVHESTHLMIRDALGRRNVELPSWLNEGFATYMEPNVRVRSSSELYRRTPHLKAMASVSGTPDTIPLFYQKSVSVVAHMIEEYGEDRFRQLLAEMARGNPVDLALVNVYGFDEHGLDSSWAGLPIPDPVITIPTPTPSAPESRESASHSDASGSSDSMSSQVVEDSRPLPQNQAPLPSEGESAASRPLPQNQAPSPSERESADSRPQPQQDPGEGSGPSPFIFLDAWILAGVALLAVVAVSARFIYNRLRQQRGRGDDHWDSWRDDYFDED